MKNVGVAEGRARLIGVLFIGYVGYYFCRVTVPVALPQLNQVFQLSNTESGLILSTYFAVYSFSKLINGVLGDRIGGKVLMMVGIAGSVLCNLIFGLGAGLLLFAGIWGANAFFQSMGWPGLISIMSRTCSRFDRGRSMAVVSLSYQLGDFVARTSAGLVLIVLSWRGLFFGHAAVLAAIGVSLLFLLPRATTSGPRASSKRNRIREGAEGQVDEAGGDREPASIYLSHLRLMLSNRWFWVVCSVYLCLSVVRYIFWGWSVSYLATQGGTMTFAVLASAIFPLSGSLGTLFAGWASDRLSARRGPVLAVMSSAMALSVLLFSQIGSDQPTLLALTLGVVGFSLYGPYSLMAGAVAIDFGSSHSSATAAGVIDSVGALGSIVTGVGMGYLIDRFGWNHAFLTVFSIAMVAALLSFLMWRWRSVEVAGRKSDGKA